MRGVYDSLGVFGVGHSDHGFGKEVVEEAGLAVLGEAYNHVDIAFKPLDLPIADLED